MAEYYTAAVLPNYLSNVASESEDNEHNESFYFQDNELSDRSKGDGEPSSNHVEHATTKKDNSSTVTPGSSGDISLVAKKSTS